jgi:hypothetical protein
MKDYISEKDKKNFIFNNISVSHFAKLKNLSKNDQDGIRVAY